ncbi:MAG: hypothetical protein GY778_08060 [bacterium]|nr:hypothetical protein [bacterium]
MTGPLITDMRAMLSQLVAEQTKVEAQISAISTAIDAMTANPSGAASIAAKPVRLPGDPFPGSLKEAVNQVLVQCGTPLGPVEIAERVLKGGYQTQGTNLANMIGTCLRGMSHVKKAGRGRYRV